MPTAKKNAATATTFRHRTLVFCGSVLALAVATVAPIRSAALSTVAQGLHTSHLALLKAPRPKHLSVHKELHTGYWHTEGGRIVSDRRATVHINGVNWSGLETPAAVPGGLDRQDYRTILSTMAAQGFNTIRVPFSNQMVEAPTVPTAISFQSPAGPINADLEGLDSLEILDHIVSAAGELGLKVILDDHRSEAGSSAEANGLWYTDQYPEQAWIADWVTLANRYKGNPTVIGVDLRNEPHNASSNGACWDCGETRDWHLAAQRAGNAVLRTNPNLLVFVEGVDSYEGDSYWWGGNLAGVRRSPVHLAVANHLVYSTHVYGPNEYQQPWFNAGTTPQTLAAKWHHNWGFISESGIAPVWIGEFGTPNDDQSVTSQEPGSNGQWFQALIGYLRQNPQIGWSYWGLNGEDRYGLLDSQYANPASQAKMVLLSSLMHTAITAPLAVATPAPRLAESNTSVPQTFTQPYVASTSQSIAQPALIQPVIVQPTTEPIAQPSVQATEATVVYAAPTMVAHNLQIKALAPHTTRLPRQHTGTNSDTVADSVRRATQQALRGLANGE